jgi:hypothetical protein
MNYRVSDYSAYKSYPYGNSYHYRKENSKLESQLEDQIK